MFVLHLLFRLGMKNLLSCADRWGNGRAVCQDYPFSRDQWEQSDVIFITGLVTVKMNADWTLLEHPRLSTLPSIPDQAMSLPGVSKSRQVSRPHCCSESGCEWDAPWLKNQILRRKTRTQFVDCMKNCECNSQHRFAGFCFKWGVFRELVWKFRWHDEKCVKLTAVKQPTV